MTSEEWDRCADYQQLLRAIGSTWSADLRRRRLLANACFLQLMRSGLDDDLRFGRCTLENVIDVSEQFAEKHATAKAMRAYNFEISRWKRKNLKKWNDKIISRTEDAVDVLIQLTSSDHPDYATLLTVELTLRQSWKRNPGEYASGVSDLLRDIFGNPFRPVAIDPDWLTWRDGTIPNLAQTIYDDRRFDILPILADALQEAGCINEDIIQHCHSPGPHVRGCWVVDLLLGKK